MKNFALVALAAAPLLMNAPMASADVGLGVDLGNNGLGAGLGVPIRMGTFRVEPELYMLSYTFTNTPAGGGVPSTYTSKSSGFGAGAYFAQQMGGNMEGYVGVRLLKLKVTQTFASSAFWSSNQQNSTQVLPTIGLDYFLSPKLSLGVRVSYFLINSQTSTYGATGVASTGSGQSTGYTTGFTTVRYYF